MKKTTITLLLLLTVGTLAAQPGRPGGPGGQYSERMEMMMVWKLTDHLELTEAQAEKFFPTIRQYRKGVQKIRKEEMTLFKPMGKKANKGKEIKKSDVDKLLAKINSLEQKKSKARVDFIKKSGKILTPNQQVKLLMFEDHMKQQVKGRMQDRYEPPKRGGMNQRKKRF